jgi:AcrR family transcriptional regulator
MATRSDTTKCKLYDAALALIAEKGFAGTTVDEIVERAGVAKGTVYYHFAGKAELVEALIAERLTPLQEQFRMTLEAACTPSAALEALVRAELEWIRDNRSFSKMLMTELWREERIWHDTLFSLRHSIIGYFERAIADGIAAGVFRSDIDAAFAASALFGMTVTSALDWLVFSPETPLDTVAEQIRRLASMAVTSGSAA